MGETTEIELPEELIQPIQQFLKDHPEAGYKSLDEFVSDSLEKQLKKLVAEDRTKKNA